MISFDEALQTILQHAKSLGVVNVSLKKTLGYVLAQAVSATFDLPSFNNSAMDGYGVQFEDLKNASKEHPAQLILKETIQAGDTSLKKLTPGSAVKIFTGAPIPTGVDAVVMKEVCEEKDGTVFFSQSARKNENIRFQGEEFKKGQSVISSGTLITPPVIGLLANLGYESVSVYRKPNVSILVTGNELVSPGASLKPGQIYDSNSYALIAALNDMGITDIPVFYTRDEKDETHQKFKQALSDHDIIITLGGVSVGDYDFIKEVVETEGAQTLFWRIAIKPGKPVYFGEIESLPNNKLIFGLPGNPVSALVTFHQLVRPALLKVMGKPIDPSLQLTEATLQESFKKRPGRLEFIRGVYSTREGETTVKSTRGQSSHMLGGLAVANCLIHFPEAETHLNSGDTVFIEPLQWDLIH